MKNPAHHGDRAEQASDFPIVGLGASAGGLDAFRKLFDVVPANTGMAYVLIQHLDPKHESMMVDLLAGHTPMKVLQAVDGMPVQRDHVYVMPPRTYLSVRDGSLRLSLPRERHGARMPVDFFLRSLAEECGERAICAILSGSGGDGSIGLKAVKEKGGLVIVQDPEEAAYDGMPRSAIATGSADLVLPLAKIPQALARYGRRTHRKTEKKGSHPRASTQAALAEIIDLLREKTSHTFALYKEGTLLRRIERRMAIAGIEDTGRYLELLRENSGEIELLAKDLLINVTSFFRDASAFELLAKKVVPELVRRQPPGRPLRIWVPGCSTGEETYSIGMLFIEAIAAAKRNVKLQVFASDLDADAVAFARNGLYPEAIDADVSPARLARFFAKEDHSYRIVRELRETVVFTVQDLLGDAPFSRLNLVSCRNLLIYLRPEVQEKVLALFHFALSEGGVLFLGTSETVSSLEDRFTPVFKKQRIYRRIGRSRPGEANFPIGIGEGTRPPWPRLARQVRPRDASLADLSQRSLLDAYAPASVLINRRYEGLYYSGKTDGYLRVATGEVTRDLLAMVREGLRTKLRAAIHQASEKHARVIVTGARVSRDGSSTPVSIAVQPLQTDGEELLLVSFLDEPKCEQGLAAAEAPADATRTAQLEQELDITRIELQSVIRDLEASNEDLKAINEEAMSVNEEFQSTNEELETSKEELQSLNEELTALNTQLQETVEQHRATSNDLQNILDSSDLAMLFLDGNLNIRFFTPAAKSLFSVISSDIGRSLADLRHHFGDADLLADARTVLASLTPLRREIEADNGSWYIERVLPYRTHTSGVEGVVFTFADISEMKAAEREIQVARVYSDSIVDTIRQPLIVLDDALCVVSASRSFYRAFAVEPAETVGRPLTSAGDRRLDVPAFRGFLDLIRASDVAVEDYEIEIDLPSIGRRTLLLNAGKVREEPLAMRKILVAIDDVTDRKRVETALGASKLQAEQANLGKSRFLAAASHDLRQPLQTLSLVQGILAKKLKDADALQLVAKLDETLGAMTGLLNTLLDINQLEAGIVQPELMDFPVNDLLDRLRTEFTYHMQANSLELSVVPNRLTICSDPRLLEQMIRNLMSNAVKYTKRGKILLGCRRHGGMLRIEVWDTGIGIPETQFDAIFEEFHQLENPARERSRGLGLGLAIVQRLGNLLGHSVDVRSRPGIGSVFSVEVPFGERAPVGPPEREEPVVASTGHSSAILVVEDDPATREMLELLFTGEGYRTASAADGKEALAMVARGAARPDIIIADFNLPGGLTGLQVVAGVRKTLHREIPVVILTGDISTGTLREIARRGCIQRNKPVKAQELTRLVGSLLAELRTPPLEASAKRPAEAARRSPLPTVFVVDDDRAVREAMRGMLEQAGRSVEIYASAEEFLQSYRPGRYGCLLADARMPDMDGIELLDRLKAEGHELPSIVITGYGDVPLAVRAMKAGAAGFIEKPVRPDELLASIGRVLEETRDSAELASWREEAARRIAGLTTRQRQVMDLVIEGNPNKEIAAVLGISQRTIENHRAAVMKKIGASSLSQLIHLAFAASQDNAPHYIRD